MSTKRKDVEVTLKKKKALQEPEKGKSAKDVAAKYNLPKSSLRGRRMMKNL